MASRSERTSDRFLVPSMFLRVVWASSRVAKSALDTLAMDLMGSLTRKYTTPSTATVTESLVKTYTRRIHKVSSWQDISMPHWHMTYPKGDKILLSPEKSLSVNISIQRLVGLYPCAVKMRGSRGAHCTSWGGISKETVLMSTFTKESVHGRMKKMPEENRERKCEFPTFHPAPPTKMMKYIPFIISSSLGCSF